MPYSHIIADPSSDRFVPVGPVVILMSDYEINKASLKTKGQPKYLVIPEELILANSSYLASLSDSKQTSPNQDPNDNQMYHPSHTQKPRDYITEKRFYMMTVLHYAADTSDGALLRKMPDPQKWRAVHAWGKWLISGLHGKRRFLITMDNNVRDDLKILARVLGCGKNFVEAVDKAYDDAKLAVLFTPKKKVARPD